MHAEIYSFEDSLQNSPQQESLDEKEQQKHLIAIENAMQDGGQLDHTLIHGVFVGPPRSGKDSLMNRLLGKKLANNNSPSTGVVENVVHVKVEESSTFAAAVEQSSWVSLEYDEEALCLMKAASNRSNVNGRKDITESITLAPKDVERTSIQTQEGSDQIIKTSSEELSPTSQSMAPLEKKSQTHTKPSSKHMPPMEIFKDAIKTTGLEGLKKQLSKSWSLYHCPPVNTGGQMEFQELLPLLVSDLSFFLLHFNFTKTFISTFPLYVSSKVGRNQNHTIQVSVS